MSPKKRIHFIAIGGAIMHQLALALHRQGHTVTGSDDDINDPAKTNLQQAGLLPSSYGWHADKVTSEIDEVVLGMHAKADNPELLRAQALNIPILSFPEYVYQVSENKKRVVIAGSHGKTTITSMVMHVLQKAGLDFDYLVGAKVPGFDSSVRLTEAPIIVLEGDEYPASAIERKPKIFFYQPHITLLSGIAWDHINIFPTYENYKEQFQYYVSNLLPSSQLIYCEEDSEVVDVVQTQGAHTNTVAYHAPKYSYEGMHPILQTAGGEHIPLQVFGRHNMLNMEGAKQVCICLGITEKEFYQHIASYGGAAKRLEEVYKSDHLLVYRDFAHAPSKLQATLQAVKEAMEGKLLIACFELHTYSSLSEAFLNQYAHAMDAADEAIVYYSQHAISLKGLPDIDPEEIHKHFARESLRVINQKNLLEETLMELSSNASQPVCILLMSSGTFDGIDVNQLVSQLK